MEIKHDGHRERLKQRFRDEGLTHFDDLNVLELLLFYAVPRRDTNPIAHALMDRFGSLRAVLEARPEDLAAVPGVGENAATLLNLLPQLLRRYWADSAPAGKTLTTTAQLGQYFMPIFFLERDELVYLLSLDARCKVLDCTLVNHGTVTTANVPVRRVVEIALRHNAASVVLAHNHVSGVALPSPEDIATTENIARALRAVGVELADHIIVSENDFVSLKDSGMLP